MVDVLGRRDRGRPHGGMEGHRHRKSAGRRRHSHLHGLGAATHGAAARAARRGSRHGAGQRARVHRQRLPLLRRHHRRLCRADVRSETVRNVANHCLRSLRRVPGHTHRVLACALHCAASQRPILPELIGQRHDRQSDLRLLLGHGAVPARVRHRREGVHQLSFRHDRLAAAGAHLRAEELRDLGLRRQHVGVGGAADDLLHEVLLVGVGLHAHHRHHARPRRLLHLLGLPGVYPRLVRLCQSVPRQPPRPAGSYVEPGDPIGRYNGHRHQLPRRQAEAGRATNQRPVPGVGPPTGSDPRHVHGGRREAD